MVQNGAENIFFRYIYCMMWEVVYNKGLIYAHLQKLPINSLTLGKILSLYVEYSLQIAWVTFVLLL